MLTRVPGMSSQELPTQLHADYIPAAEVAAALGITTRTLRSYVRYGHVRPTLTLPSGRARWTRADIERLRSAGVA